MKRLKSSKGQMTIEAVLLMSIMIMVFTIVQKTFREKDYMTQLVQGPWGYIQGMVENGVWMKYDMSNRKHPNSYGRRASPEPI